MRVQPTRMGLHGMVVVLYMLFTTFQAVQKYEKLGGVHPSILTS